MGAEPMSDTVFCVKLGQEGQKLKRQPYPGELGERIFANVSQEGWKMWLGHQTMLINEYRLSPMDPKARSFLEQEMENFFFGEGSAPPPDFQPTE